MCETKYSDTIFKGDHIDNLLFTFSHAKKKGDIMDTEDDDHIATGSTLRNSPPILDLFITWFLPKITGSCCSYKSRTGRCVVLTRWVSSGTCLESTQLTPPPRLAHKGIFIITKQSVLSSVFALSSPHWIRRSMWEW